MSKQLAHLVLIISLVGQFLLTPAMAMPRLLHTYSHTQMNAMEHNSDINTEILATQLQSEFPPLQTLTLTNSPDSEQSCSTMVNIKKSSNLDISIDCDALCEMMGVGECISHCSSATGILIQAHISLLSPESSGPIQTGFWSTQTAEPAPFNPPPIRTV
ncbi:hypothetical protein [Shewanella nanhaiensis]|uniref:Uncharacterized protein n=1 Tax=Shewanella nanhaiensis TaxID=2864872 RepID=A0ABS7E6N2_9GAMM|nr:hypothetical protein [Shewanella nanhaiensis]MBW8185310.1 hypothetical protein [Shewanella nanhaiensis]